MEKLYTPEPWEASDRVIRNIAETVYEGRVICRIPDETLAPLGYANWDANARRIVACVNACRSVSDEDLADDCVEKMKSDRDALLIQRDKLLAALNLVAGISCEIDTIERCESWEGGSPEYGTVVTFGKIKQRISKVKSLIEKYHA